MGWTLLGAARLVHASGPDVARSTAERAAGESIWVPTALARLDEVKWSAPARDHIGVVVETDGHEVTLEHEIDEHGQLRASHFDRWGDPDDTGTWQLHPFGVETTGHRSFGGATIPCRGHAGWHYGTSRWPDGISFRFEITRYELLA
jgi:hypothetical protein